VKQVIELLEQARHQLGDIAITTIQDFERELTVKDCINKALSILQSPCWETPEQREKRTGKPWPDDWAVYALYETNDGERQWFCESYGYAQHKGKKKGNNPRAIICATEAGRPPDGWEPEEKNNAAQ
jgi:hypothetical protein